MADFDVVSDRLRTAYAGFRDRLCVVRADQWRNATPCGDWTVRLLVNHVVLAELGYALLLRGGSGGQFLALQDRDALGDDPLAAYDRATAECLSAFGEPGTLARIVDYPLGAIPGRQLLDLRLTETVIHTWDLARAIGADDRLDPRLVEWVHRNLDRIYDNVADSPVSSAPSHQFFAAPQGTLPGSASPQDRLLHLMGRVPGAGPGHQR